MLLAVEVLVANLCHSFRKFVAIFNQKETGKCSVFNLETMATLRKAYPLPPADLQGQTTPAPEENNYSVQLRDFLVAVLHVYKNICAIIILFFMLFSHYNCLTWSSNRCTELDP